jgi:hypothetical protein
VENLSAAEFLKLGMNDKVFLQRIAENCWDYDSRDLNEPETIRIRRQLTLAGNRMGCHFTERQMGSALNTLKGCGFFRVIFNFGRVIRTIRKMKHKKRMSENK